MLIDSALLYVGSGMFIAQIFEFLFHLLNLESREVSVEGKELHDEVEDEVFLVGGVSIDQFDSNNSYETLTFGSMDDEGIGAEGSRGVFYDFGL